LTIEPPPAFLMSGMAFLVQLNMPVRSMAMQRSQSSGEISSTLPVGPAMPALLTSTSRPPSAFCTSTNRRSTSERTETSAFVRPMSLSSAASALSSTSQTKTRAPASRNVRAVARPIPAAPAVMSTLNPSSPLLNAYLLPVITSALTLGKVATLANVGVIAICYVFLAAGAAPEELASLRFLAGFAAQLAPVLLVAYITTMFSADIHYGLQRATLLSETDELTGLYNTRGFAIAANRLFGQAQRYGRPAAVLMIDSDNLKEVNDTHGHDAGNRLLRGLAGAIQAELRSTDVPARYGGDEFIVLLPETAPQGALEVAERIRGTICAAPLLIGEKRIASTVSVGVACFPEDGRNLDALAGRADRALYHAKQRGRNRVLRYHPS
jgi:diguanylate cyclase (GGDEF)-like protein